MPSSMHCNCLLIRKQTKRKVAASNFFLWRWCQRRIFHQRKTIIKEEASVKEEAGVEEEAGAKEEGSLKGEFGVKEDTDTEEEAGVDPPKKHYSRRYKRN